MMSSYGLSRTLPSCKVDRTLLKEIEQYIQQRITALVPPPEGKKIDYELYMTESIGTEKFKSIEEYEKIYFPDDMRRIGIKSSMRVYTSRISVDLSFDRSKFWSNIQIDYTGPAARETAISLSDEIIRRIQPYKTNNHYFERISGYGIFALLISVANTAQIIFVPWPERPFKNVVKVISIAIAFAILTYWILTFLKPYSTFKTRLNEKREKWTTWVWFGFLGFLLFTVLGVYLRKRILGF